MLAFINVRRKLTTFLQPSHKLTSIPPALLLAQEHQKAKQYNKAVVLIFFFFFFSSSQRGACLNLLLKELTLHEQKGDTSIVRGQDQWEGEEVKQSHLNYKRATLMPLQNRITGVWLNSTGEETRCAGPAPTSTNQFKPLLPRPDYPQNYLEAQCHCRRRYTGSLQRYPIKSKHCSFDCRSQNLCGTEPHWTTNPTANLPIVLRLK